MIPQFNLNKEYNFLENEIQKELKKVFFEKNFIGGENVTQIEKNIAKYIGVNYAASCNSGTDALYLALNSIGIRKGDEVITTPFTFISTIEAIIYLGAKPVFADIDLDSYNISKEKILEKISNKTKAILPVHIFGNPVDMRLKSCESELDLERICSKQASDSAAEKLSSEQKCNDVHILKIFYLPTDTIVECMRATPEE